MLNLHSPEIQQLISVKTQRNFPLFCRGHKCFPKKTAALAGVNCSAVKHYFKGLRLLIAQDSLRETVREAGAFELAASCFGARRVLDKRGRKAAGKIPIFGLLKHNGMVFVKIIKDCSIEGLLSVIQFVFLFLDCRVLF